ncbi:hypothetical protein FQA39_LY15522 [Lamprigera yunnana]|nr:hypothetical protein FQA39_LY15522 [Lamprigera yunnana]
MTFDTDSCENNTVEAAEVEQSIDLPWSILEVYDANNEARLLRYGDAAEETLINSTRYDLDNKGKYIKIGYSNARFSKNNVLLDTYEWEKFTELEPHMMNQFFYDSSEIQLTIQNMCTTVDITDDATISYHSEYSECLSSSMGSMIAATVSDPMRNGDSFIKTITLQRDYRTCTFNRYDVEAIFHLKAIINFRLKIIQSSGFKDRKGKERYCFSISSPKEVVTHLRFQDFLKPDWKHIKIGMVGLNSETYTAPVFYNVGWVGNDFTHLIKKDGGIYSTLAGIPTQDCSVNIQKHLVKFRSETVMENSGILKQKGRVWDQSG